MHERRFRWTLEALIYRLAEKGAGLLPRRAVFRLGSALGSLAWYLIPARRHTVLRNLRIAFAGEMSPQEIQRTAREVFRRTGGNMVFSLLSPSFSAEEANARIVHTNREVLLEAAAGGGGIILLIPHMGNWELLSHATSMAPEGVARGAHYRPLNNPVLDEQVRAQREARGTHLFSKGLSLHELTSFVRKPGLLAILGDQRAGKVGEVHAFFGRLTSCSPMASLLARRTRARLLVASIETLPTIQWRITYELLPAGATTPQCMAALERAMRRSPADVFWLQDRWKGHSRRPYQLVGKLPATGFPPFTKPRRGLIWLARAESAPPADLPPPAPDLVLEYALPPGAAAPDWIGGALLHRPAADTPAALAAIDESAALPLDFVASFPPSTAVAAAALKLGIPYASPPRKKEPEDDPDLTAQDSS